MPLAVLLAVLLLVALPSTANAVADAEEPAPGAAAASTTLTNTALPRMSGTPRWGKRMTVTTGSWTPKPSKVTYQWLRNGVPVGGANAATYTVKLADFGQRLSVKVAAHRAGYTKGAVYTARSRVIDHRVPVTKRFTYSLGFRGPISTSTRVFKEKVAAAFEDPRGWRSAGYEFTRVASGGSFTVVLSAASAVPSFGSPCSKTWSCRVGRYVIINQNRWVSASPAWNAAGLALNDYRHLVVNHEAGHWLGHRHTSCAGPGRLAPVMMQQSKGRDGCRFNPFPLPSERWTTR